MGQALQAEYYDKAVPPTEAVQGPPLAAAAALIGVSFRATWEAGAAGADRDAPDSHLMCPASTQLVPAALRGIGCTAKLHM